MKPLLVRIVDHRLAPIAGVLAVEPDARGDVTTIASLVVHPDRQGQGFGGRLLGAVTDTHGSRPIEVSTAARNEPALRLYASFGFMAFQRRLVGPHGLEIVSLRRARSEVAAGPLSWALIGRFREAPR